MNILVTGGAGYIGSHTSLLLLEAGHKVIVLDNFSNSSSESIKRVEEITGKPIVLVEGDIRNQNKLEALFSSYEIDIVIHFAGLKAVGESVEKPMKYYETNVYGTVQLCKVMAEHGCRSIVFSSSATVYGDPHSVPIKEDFSLHPTNPYGRTKLMIEEMLRDLYISDNQWKVILLRYFNPVGAHESGKIGEDPNDIPNNLMPLIAQTAVGKREKISIFGNDYNTHDGTGVRDYIHVMDLSEGHLKALEKIGNMNGVLTINLGTGRGYSVFDMVKTFEKVSGKEIPYVIAPRRSGDIAQCYADPSYAKEVLGWEAEKGIEEMCEDTWRWQSMNPKGYH
ncbi:MAG: UDP-glucose 4-epimerase GalE [Sulfurovum sp.]|nr:UDP-glucose 4-epimerase GalE [Sulfurovum sp.]MCB4760601.1 UDP-glucose 4-epimerase GalE [Sulfurovum sp.]MCB4772708.1 UDP-glucose 4-epimerase GalE [Sulfurovum sp.]MCB4780867.1 UDP-glucose 4-epimerase GalE [Sulfurovum sp.]MCB4783534.1 UDP-glucose 4-epimerase GalE [Sulfurovum sp.]